ncbi:type II toxin-antitoxin system death-on-curing family toxin [Ekhidna sp. MALMAid0563]|uniref:type II toxin-antitoxin system death-on-curing family toxin n=1 Tax=Ekhidna sp. MALMAid0563 TaxID=3143937 RepID=UPI0032DF4376
MSKKRVTTKSLAAEAEMDLDEALVMLWDVGIDEVINENTLIPSKKIALAKSTLGVSNKNELLKIDFWRKKLNNKNHLFEEVAETLDISVGPKMRKLPKGALKKLRQYAKQNGISIGTDSELPIKPESQEAVEPFEFTIIGNEEEISFITYDEVVDIHYCLVQDFANHADPISPPGIKNDNLLQSAIFRPHTSFGERLKYPTPEMAGAALCHSLVNNHAFHNGNKRTALVSLLVFLDKQNMIVTCKEEEIFKFILKVAQHGIVKYLDNYDDREVLEISKWIHANSRKIESGDRVITWRRLEKILREYGCEINQVAGSRFNVSRSRPMKRYFNLRSEKLITQVRIPVGGGDVPIFTVKKLRKDLKLDEDYGVDSNYFYMKEPQKIDDFINTYRKTLYRLAKL